MKAQILTVEQIKSDNGREYNPSIWLKNIESYLNFKDVTFFKVDKGGAYSYDRYFVAYTLPSGLNLLDSFSYSTSLSNRGFQEAIISNIDIDFDENDNPIVTKAGDNEVFIKGRTFFGKWLNSSNKAREWATEQSKKYGHYFTQEGI